MTSAERAGAERYQPRAYQRKVGALVVAATLLSGCGSGLGGNQVVTTVRAPEVPAEPLVLELLADGEVTVADLNQAFHAYVDCMEDAGMIGRHAYAEPLGLSWTMEYSMPADPDGSRADALESRCYGRFMSPLEARFEDPFSGLELELQHRQSTINCLVGVDPSFSTIPADVSVDSVSDLYRETVMAGNDAAAECIETAGVGWTEFGRDEGP